LQLNVFSQNTMNHKQLILCIAILLTNTFSFAQNNVLHFNHKANLALSGYDPVSYFNNNPQLGDSKLRHEYEGLIYYFTSEVNLQHFKKSPSSFIPQYGGWCAYAMGIDGSKVKIDPNTYKIINGKLYLFYNFYFNNTLEDWNKDEIKLRTKADEYWLKIMGQ